MHLEGQSGHAFLSFLPTVPHADIGRHIAFEAIRKTFLKASSAMQPDIEMP
jgi:hypothetical protein